MSILNVALIGVLVVMIYIIITYLVRKSQAFNYCPNCKKYNRSMRKKTGKEDSKIGESLGLLYVEHEYECEYCHELYWIRTIGRPNGDCYKIAVKK